MDGLPLSPCLPDDVITFLPVLAACSVYENAQGIDGLSFSMRWVD